MTSPTGPYPRMPGGGISRRPLHFIILADCSGGMKGEKIQALNFAIADMLPHLAAWERDQEQAQVFIRAIAFATEPWWHIAEPQPVAELGWRPLQPVAKGLTNLEIGNQMTLSEKTVKNYVSAILSKLEVSRRSEAAAYLARHTREPGSL